MDESEPIIPPEAKKKRFQWIEPVVFLYNIYFFGSFTLISQLIVHMLTLKREKNAFSVHNSTEECSVKGNRMSESSLVLMYADIAAIVPSFFMTILIGGYSDSHGRLSAILFSLVGASLRLIIIFLMFIFDLSVYFLVLSSFVDSFFGMSATFLTSSYAYLADVTTSESRSQRVVLMEVFAGLGSIMSNLLVGYFISNLGYAWSLVILLSIIFFTTVYVSLLKESNESSTSQQTPLMSLRHFTETFKLFKKNERYSRFTLLFTLLLLFLISFSEFGSVNVQVLVIISTPLCLGPIVVGYFLTLVTTCNITCNWICTTLIGKLLGDVGLSLLGAIFGISFYLFFAFSSTKALLFAGMLSFTSINNSCSTHLSSIDINITNSSFCGLLQCSAHPHPQIICLQDHPS